MYDIALIILIESLITYSCYQLIDNKNKVLPMVWLINGIISLLVLLLKTLR